MADTTPTSSCANFLEKFTSYVKTQKGIILAAEILISFIITICYFASVYYGYSGTAICQMVFSTLFFGIFMMEVDKKVKDVNWIGTDLFRAIVGTVAYIVTSLICVIGGAGDGAHIAGGVLGVFAGLLFAYDTYTIYLQIRSNMQQTELLSDGKV